MKPTMISFRFMSRGILYYIYTAAASRLKTRISHSALHRSAAAVRVYTISIRGELAHMRGYILLHYCSRPYYILLHTRAQLYIYIILFCSRARGRALYRYVSQPYIYLCSCPLRTAVIECVPGKPYARAASCAFSRASSCGYHQPPPFLPLPAALLYIQFVR